MGQAKLKGRTLEARRQRALDEGRTKRRNMSAAERDAALVDGVVQITAKVLTVDWPLLSFRVIDSGCTSAPIMSPTNE